MKTRIRGVALGTVLACLLALMVVLFAAVSASVSHLNFASASTRQEHAQNLADAAISEAIDQLVSSNYTLGASGSGGVTVTFNGLADAEGSLSFSNSGVFFNRQSTNNLNDDNQISGGAGRLVPGRTVHLVARGRVGSTERWVECLYHKPPFPDGLITTGPIDARTIHLVGIRQEGAYAGGDPNSIPLQDTIPGNLFSNSALGFAAGGPASEVSQNSLVTGSVGAVGTVDVDASTLVEGELLPGSDDRPIPDLNINQKITLLEPNAIPIGLSHVDLSLDPNWFSLASSDLNISGNLQLNGSALLVRGDLNVARAVTGTGIILVDGDVNIGGGGVSVVSGDQVAIGCTGDFRLQASGPNGNYFKGLIYCEGDLEAREITVVGVTVVHGKNGSVGSARLENVRFIYNPGAVQLVLQKPRGREEVDHSLAISFTLRPSDVPGEYLCSARAYFGFGDDIIPNSGSPNVVDEPQVWPSLDAQHAVEPWFQDFQDVPVGAPGPTFGATLGQQIGAWADAVENPEVRANWTTLTPPWFTQMLNDSLTSTGDTYYVTFNLNNLLAESMGSARVLYWRPLK